MLDRPALRWASLLTLSLAFVALLELARLPAALLLGPMVAAIVLSVGGGTVRLPKQTVVGAQAILGCMIARAIPPSILAEMARDWPLFLGGIGSVIVASSALGYLLTRWRVLPGTAAVWGSSAGAASAMTLMADAYGADVRLVAFMQYLRVFFVAAAASLVAKLFGASASGAVPDIVWFPPVAWGPFAGTLAVAVFGVVAARFLRVPAGPLLLPMAAGVALHGGGWLTIELPPWLLAVSYAFIGWSIGLRFNRAIFVHVARALPHVVGSTLALIALCGLFAMGLVLVADVDPLTAYLATSPGGADSVAIIATSSQVDVPFVMAMQTARLVLVLLVGPPLARFIANRTAVADKAG
ncbi:AbrB family transcriptional regulator [Azospirillum canadense]|uniref:AbrB family transcriptional regulator n=1 Tax=Azospirillum canadense TaxID=403962 RepID=UPI002225FD65|nr:AbrB family transcriptional regulator [Azospirillum canadense]MCW2238675.1 membrane AbrB-like protein [Azospirillum canadense]